MPDGETHFLNVPSFAELRHTPDVAKTWKPAAKDDLDRRIRECRRCPGLNLPAEGPDEATLSAPGRGSLTSPVMLVGQSLCGAPCIEAQMPFTKGSGLRLDEALALAGLGRDEVFITNVVHCHPPGNRESKPHEIAYCAHFLAEELRIVYPRLIIALGRDAHVWFGAWTSSQADRFTTVSDWHAPASDAGRLIYTARHPRWASLRPQEERLQYIQQLAAAMRWAFEHPTVPGHA